MCLNLNSVFILVLMLKSCLTWLRSTWIGKYLPIDQHIQYHKAVAVIISILSILHCVGHLGRYGKSQFTCSSAILLYMYIYVTIVIYFSDSEKTELKNRFDDLSDI